MWWDGLDKGVCVLTGDLHNSFAIKITDNVYEFASGPHNSINHAPMKDEGGRPSNGKFKYGPRSCDIRWSSYAMGDIPRANRTFPHYCVVQIYNVFNNPLERDGERHPQLDPQARDLDVVLPHLELQLLAGHPRIGMDPIWPDFNPQSAYGRR